jgi:hypothetical protein
MERRFQSKGRDREAIDRMVPSVANATLLPLVAAADNGALPLVRFTRVDKLGWNLRRE